MNKTLKLGKILLAGLAVNALATPTDNKNNTETSFSNMHKDFVDILVEFLDPKTYLKLR